MALIQAVLGVEFLLTGLSKFADRRYFANFQTFVLTSPGTQQGIIAALMKAIVLPHATLTAQAARFAELTAGLVLLITAVRLSAGACKGASRRGTHTSRRRHCSQRSRVSRSPGCHLRST